MVVNEEKSYEIEGKEVSLEKLISTYKKLKKAKSTI